MQALRGLTGRQRQRAPRCPPRPLANGNSGGPRAPAAAVKPDTSTQWPILVTCAAVNRRDVLCLIVLSQGLSHRSVIFFRAGEPRLWVTEAGLALEKASVQTFGGSTWRPAELGEPVCAAGVVVDLRSGAKCATRHYHHEPP